MIDMIDRDAAIQAVFDWEQGKISGTIADAIAALPAVTLPADVAGVVAEAGKVLEGVTPGPWRVDGDPWNQIVWSGAENRVCFMAHSNGLDDARDVATARFIAWCREGVPALISLATAQEAQIAGLEADAEKARRFRDIARTEALEWHTAKEVAETALAAMTKERDEYKRLAAAGELIALEQRITEGELAAERAKVAKLVEVERTARKLEKNLGVKGVDVGSLRVDLYRALAALSEAEAHT